MKADCMGCGRDAAPDLNAMCRRCYSEWVWRSTEFARAARIALEKARNAATDLVKAE